MIAPLPGASRFFNNIDELAIGCTTPHFIVQDKGYGQDVFLFVKYC